MLLQLYELRLGLRLERSKMISNHRRNMCIALAVLGFHSCTGYDFCHDARDEQFALIIYYVLCSHVDL